MNVNADMCACCQEIWNHNNLNSVNIGKHKLYLCPDCYKQYMEIIKRAYTDGQKSLRNSRIGYMDRRKSDERGTIS